MLNSIHSDLIRGHINTIILKALYEGDRYGYDIIKEIEQKSSGQYKLKQPTLYSCLKRLETQGLISAYWGAKSNGGRRKYFMLTDVGREQFVKNQTEWEYSRTIIDNLISDKNFDLTALPPIEDITPKPRKTTIKKGDILADEDAINSDDIDDIAGAKEYFDENIEAPEFNQAQEEALDSKDNFTQQDIEANETRNDDNSNVEVSTPIFKSNKVDNYDSLDFEKIFNEKKKAKDIKPSYADGYFSSTYQPTPVAQMNSDNYFIDFNDTEETSEINTKNSDASIDLSIKNAPIQDKKDEELISSNVALENENTHFLSDNTTDSQPITPTKYSQEQNANDSYSNQDYVKPQNLATKNIDYSKSYISKEYKNMLSSIVNIERKITPVNKSSATSASESKATNRKHVQSNLSVMKYTSPNAKSKKKVIDDDGDVIIRNHEKGTSKEFNSLYYYYSNKLMLVQYAILFGIMLFEISAVFLIFRLGVNITQKYDLFYYLAAIVLALVFPITAVISNSIDPLKQKRYTYTFMGSMAFRIIAFIQLVVAIYAINLWMGMPLETSVNYYVSLFLPAVMCINIPLSGVLFNQLYKSQKYAVE